MVNINEKTGIAYGIVSVNSLDSDLVNSLMFDHGFNHSESFAIREAVTEFLMEKLPEDIFDSLPDSEYEREADDLGFNWDQDFCIDEPQISGEFENVRYETCWLGGALNFVIFESPVITDSARRGSPCIPGMGVLDTLDGDFQCYDVPGDWRASE